MSNPTRRRALALVALTALVTLLAVPPRARAADEVASVPDVVGKPLDEARETLRGAGFLVATFDVAGTPPGTVDAQTPASGGALPRGAVVILDVRVQGEAGTAPKAVGLSLAEASTAFGSLYALRFQPGQGAPGDKGTVVAQEPAMGAPLPVHGVLTLTFVPDPALPASVPMPDASGLSPSDAMQALAAAGLHAHVARISLAGAPPDTVISQSPPAGTDTPRYATVDLVVTVAAEAPPAPSGPATVLVPNVVGLSESSARAELTAADLGATVEWVDGDPAQAFLVQSQDPTAGESLPAGGSVKVSIVRYAPPPPGPGPGPTGPTQAAVPSLIGLTQAQAEDLLASLGLVANPVLVPNPSVVPLRVFGQVQLPGSVLTVGSQVTFRVSLPPPPSAPIPVPNFYGRSKGQALVLAAQAGLSLSIQEVVTNAWPPHRVFSQNVAAWSYVPLGAVVTVRLARPPAGPPTTTVPDLTGRSQSQAITLLSNAGLGGNSFSVYDVSHPAFRVFAQSVAAGTPVPVGTSVDFKIANPTLGAVPTPSLIGKTKAQAMSLVASAGLVPLPQELVQGGYPPGTVFDQTPAAGAPRLPGQAVAFKVAKALTVIVPNLAGRTGPQAVAILQGLGLSYYGYYEPAPPGNPLGRVWTQNPAAGASVVGGTLVKFWVADNGAVLMVPVPNLVGMTEAAAKALLLSKGLVPNAIHVNVPSPPNGIVFAQAPVAPTSIAQGSTVSFKVAMQVFVTVPNLIGLKPADAKTALENRGLVSDGSMFVAPFKPHNRVYSQSLGVGASVPQGTVVHWKWNP